MLFEISPRNNPHSRDLYFYDMRLNAADMERYVKSGLAVHARSGGLLVGRSHEEGGILFWIKDGNDYVLKGEVEGYEYILNGGASSYFSEYLGLFNNHVEHAVDTFKIYLPDPIVSIIDTREDEEAKFLLFDHQDFWIVNKHSTKGFLKTLNEMNRAITLKPINSKEAILMKNTNSDIPIYFYDKYLGCFPRPIIDGGYKTKAMIAAPQII